MNVIGVTVTCAEAGFDIDFRDLRVRNNTTTIKALAWAAVPSTHV